MDMKEYLQHFISLVHYDYDDALKDLSEEQFYFLPCAGANHIAYMAWHFVRAEDSLVQFVFQRKPPVWLERELDARWGLPRIQHNLPLEEAQAFRLPSLADFLEYARAVWARTDEYLAQVSDAELQRLVKIQPWGEIPVARGLGQVVIAHGRQHLGQINLSRELQGLPSMDIIRF